MGIVQSDVLAFIAKVQTDPVLKKIARKIKMVEEVMRSIQETK